MQKIRRYLVLLILCANLCIQQHSSFASEVASVPSANNAPSNRQGKASDNGEMKTDNYQYPPKETPPLVNQTASQKINLPTQNIEEKRDGEQNTFPNWTWTSLFDLSYWKNHLPFGDSFYEVNFTDCLIALFTALLSISTHLLWTATKRLWQDSVRQTAIAEKAANAALALELPWFVLEDKTKIEGDPPQYILAFGNHGRTPAIILGHQTVVYIGSELPPSPNYSVTKYIPCETDKVIGQGSTNDISATYVLNKEDWESVRANTKTLWIYGYFEYFDFMKRQFREGFCIRCSPSRVTPQDKLYDSMAPTSLSWSRATIENYTYNKRMNEQAENPKKHWWKFWRKKQKLHAKSTPDLNKLV